MTSSSFYFVEAVVKLCVSDVRCPALLLSIAVAGVPAAGLCMCLGHTVNALWWLLALLMPWGAGPVRELEAQTLSRAPNRLLTDAGFVRPRCEMESLPTIQASCLLSPKSDGHCFT